MPEEVDKELRQLEIDIPSGVTLPPCKAAEILGLSISTLKRRSSEFGIRTFWDSNGRRFSLSDIEAAIQGHSEPVEPGVLTLDFDSIGDFSIPDEFGFVVYGEGFRQRNMGRYFGPDLVGVRQWIRDRYGGGRYLLKLVDLQGRMTKYNFILEIDGEPILSLSEALRQRRYQKRIPRIIDMAQETRGKDRQ